MGESPSERLSKQVARRQRIVAMYQAGAMPKDIAVVMECSPRWVHYVLRAEGIPARIKPVRK